MKPFLFPLVILCFKLASVLEGGKGGKKTGRGREKERERENIISEADRTHCSRNFKFKKVNKAQL